MGKKSNARVHGVVGIFLLLLFLLISCAQGGDNNQNTSDVETSEPEAKTTTDSDPLQNKGIGPISSFEFGAAIDEEMVAAGKAIYEEKCVLCHNLDTELIGPSQRGVLQRRSPEWIMNLILNPAEMLQKDPIAKELLAKYNNVPMTDQQVTEEDAKKILEFFRTI